MTRQYEIMVILDPSQSDEAIAKQIEKIESMVTSSEGGEILTTDKWGKKRLAYEISGKQFGYYIVWEVRCNSQLPSELDRTMRLDANVVRHMILHIPERVLKLKQREQDLKASLELRRKKIAEQSDENEIVDMLGDVDVSEYGEDELAEAEQAKASEGEE